MSRKLTILLATLGSAALLGGAFFFQAIGYPPCAMCIWQRWPHGVAIAIGLIAMLLPGRVLPLLGALAATVTAAIGVFHTGVERDWWEGPSSCTGTGQGLGSLSGGDLLATDGPRLVMCDVVSWELIGLSMASWNALLSAGLVLLWLSALRRS
ncbi:disulfide bond formation protein B [Limimaricola sp.]|uniref:disulfide bond formation protein B n=1 Tax=Limimaricola sp. TaxID=2211665 RepID=UPI004059E191